MSDAVTSKRREWDTFQRIIPEIDFADIDRLF